MKYKAIHEQEEATKHEKKEYMKYKLAYMDDLKDSIQSMLDDFSKTHSDKRMNDLLVAQLNSLYTGMKALINFPEYELPIK